MASKPGKNWNWGKRPPLHSSRRPTTRTRLLSAWRGLPEPLPGDKEEKSVADLVNAVLKSTGVEGRLREDEVLAQWRSLVGDFVADHSRPSGIRHKILTVNVLQPAVHHTLAAMKRTLLARMKKAFGENSIKDIRFRIG